MFSGLVVSLSESRTYNRRLVVCSGRHGTPSRRRHAGGALYRLFLTIARLQHKKSEALPAVPVLTELRVAVRRQSSSPRHDGRFGFESESAGFSDTLSGSPLLRNLSFLNLRPPRTRTPISEAHHTSHH